MGLHMRSAFSVALLVVVSYPGASLADPIARVEVAETAPLAKQDIAAPSPSKLLPSAKPASSNRAQRQAFTIFTPPLPPPRPAYLNSPAGAVPAQANRV